MSIEVMNVRGTCHLQDGGRPGQASLGIPLGGYADTISAHLANALVGLPARTPLLECTLGGPTIRFESACDIAITGAEISPRIDGVAVKQWQRLHVLAGQTLSCQHAKNGLRSYISFSRRLKVERWRNSVSPLALGEAICPLTSVLKKGSRIEFVEPYLVSSNRIRKTYAYIPIHLGLNMVEKICKIELFHAPETDYLFQYPKLLAELTNSKWSVSPVSSRMGIRLESPSLSLDKTGGLMQSGPVLPGTVQLLPNGSLIITHVDSQTIGGYPRIGLVSAHDLSVLAQAVPGRTSLRMSFKQTR